MYIIIASLRKKARQRTTNIKLNGVQRLAYLGAMRTTPTTSMEVLLGVASFHLFIKKEAIAAVHGSLTGRTTTEVNTHRLLVEKIHNDHLL